jgi:hypothetical protein
VELIAENCKPDKKPLFVVFDTSLERVTSTDFPKEFYEELSKPLLDIGYCIQRLEDSNPADSLLNGNPLLFLKLDASVRDGDPENVNGYWLTVGKFQNENDNLSNEFPLLSMAFDTTELMTLQSVLVKKIVENIRTQYVCHLRIQSSPDGVSIVTLQGLEGRTPLEWILPVGDISIEGKKDGYESIQKRVDLSSAGVHTIFLQMRKRQFFNSKFIYPAIVFGLSSVTCYSLDRYYHKKYMSLGKDTYYNNPSEFEQTFNKAKRFETASIVSLACALTSLTITFFY